MKKLQNSIRKSQISETGELKRHKGYDRQIVAVPVDIIPLAAQSEETVFIKHPYKVNNGNLRNDFRHKSYWAPGTYQQEQEV